MAHRNSLPRPRFQNGTPKYPALPALAVGVVLVACGGEALSGDSVEGATGGTSTSTGLGDPAGYMVPVFTGGSPSITTGGTDAGPGSTGNGGGQASAGSSSSSATGGEKAATGGTDFGSLAGGAPLPFTGGSASTSSGSTGPVLTGGTSAPPFASGGVPAAEPETRD